MYFVPVNSPAQRRGIVLLLSTWYNVAATGVVVSDTELVSLLGWRISADTGCAEWMSTSRTNGLMWRTHPVSVPMLRPKRQALVTKPHHSGQCNSSTAVCIHPFFLLLFFPHSPAQRRGIVLLLSTWYNVAAKGVVVSDHRACILGGIISADTWCAECRRVERTVKFEEHTPSVSADASS